MKPTHEISMNFMSDRRRSLAPRTSEEEALFLARKYYENKTILEAKLANAINGGRFLRMNLLDMIAIELSTKFNVANRNRKYVEQKLRDMKKEARKYFCLVENYASLSSEEILKRCPKVPSEPVKLMMQAMAQDHMAFDSSAWERIEEKDLKQECDQEVDVNSEDSFLCSEYQQPLLSDYSISTSEETPTRPIDIILEAATSSMNKGSYSSIVNGYTEKNLTNKILPTKSSETHASKNGIASPKHHKSIIPLRRRLLSEKIEATKSFFKMCEQVTKSIQDVSTSITEAYRVQTEYFRLQMAMAGVTIENFRNKSPTL